MKTNNDVILNGTLRQASNAARIATTGKFLCIDPRVQSNGSEAIHIAVIGSGYVGLVAGACFAEMGHHVVLVDNDAEKLTALEAGKVPIHEEFLPELINKHRGKGLGFTRDLASTVRTSRVIFIAVGTPATDDGDADLSYVEQVACDIASAINEYKVIVEKSTVPVYTNEWIRRSMMLNGAREKFFDVVSNPEFLREGTAVTDFLYPDRIVVGADSPRAAGLLQQIYLPLTSGNYYQDSLAVPPPTTARIPPHLILTSAKSAELIKHASNAFLAMKIWFVNAIATICEQVGANVEEVTEGIGSDRRIGRRFLRPGIGYGGSCFPKDVSAFQAVAAESGYDFRLLDEVRAINQQQRKRFLRKVRRAVWRKKSRGASVWHSRAAPTIFANRRGSASSHLSSAMAAELQPMIPRPWIGQSRYLKSWRCVSPRMPTMPLMAQTLYSSSPIGRSLQHLI